MGHERKLAKARETVDHFMADHISRRKEELSRPKNNEPEQEEEEPTDILTSYIKNQLDGAPSDRPKSDKFVRDAMLNLLVAGKDTTSAALTWFFWLLSKNPNVETKILDELRANFSSTAFEEKLKVFDIGDIGGLVYLHAALCESLRLFPAVPLVTRVAIQDDVLPSGEKLPRGTPIFCSVYAMARMKSIWGKDCLEFKPERWISEEGTVTFEHNKKFLVFSLGPRICVGKDIAFIQMKLVVASLLYNFKFHVLESQAISTKLAAVLPTKTGLMVKVTKRDQSNNV